MSDNPPCQVCDRIPDHYYFGYLCKECWQSQRGNSEEPEYTDQLLAGTDTYVDQDGIVLIMMPDGTDFFDTEAGEEYMYQQMLAERDD